MNCTGTAFENLCAPGGLESVHSTYCANDDATTAMGTTGAFLDDEDEDNDTAFFNVMADIESSPSKRSVGSRRSISSRKSRTTRRSMKRGNADLDNDDVDTEMDSSSESEEIQATVFMISGCEDKQTSADVSNVANFSLPNGNGKAGGACTSALLSVLYAYQTAVTGLSFVQVLSQMRRKLKQDGYTQIPQLTSSQRMNVKNQEFFIVPPSCQGQKRAVLIGINYIGHESGQLSGCHNDCLNIKDYIMNVWGFKEENIVVLMDKTGYAPPTRANILKAYASVAAASRSGDAVFCHYSGHGGNVRDDNGDEDDGYDETMVPVDYATAGQIRDDDLKTTLVSAMPSGSTLVALMDCCHSATVLDLPYKYKANGWGGGVTMSGPNNKANTGSGSCCRCLVMSKRTYGKMLMIVGLLAMIVCGILYVLHTHLL